MQFNLLCTDTKLSLARPLDLLSLFEMKTLFVKMYFLLSIGETCDSWPISRSATSEDASQAQKSYQPNQQRYRPVRVSPQQEPLLWPGPPNQIPATMFYIFPSIRDFTHSFRFDPLVFLILHAFPHQSFAVTKCHRNLYFSSFSSTFATFILCFTTRLTITLFAFEILHTFTLFIIRSTFAQCWWVP